MIDIHDTLMNQINKSCKTANLEYQEDAARFDKLKEDWVNNDIDTLTYIAVLHNRIETIENKLYNARSEIVELKETIANMEPLLCRPISCQARNILL